MNLKVISGSGKTFRMCFLLNSIGISIGELPQKIMLDNF